MPDFGRELVSKIIHEDDLVSATNAGIRPTWFDDEEHRAVFTWIIEYAGRYGETPTVKALKAQFPTYRLLNVDEPYEYYIDHFRNQRKRSLLMDVVVDISDALNDGDPLRGERSLSQGLTKLGLEIGTLNDVNLVDTIDQRYFDYEDSYNNPVELVGVPTGSPTLDIASGGFQPEQFIVIGGQQKQGKSFILMNSAIAAQDAGYNVLFFSFEMSQYEQQARYDAIVSNINATSILHRRLDEDDLRAIKRGLRLRRNMADFIISADISAMTTVSSIAGKIEQHQPDIVFIDGAYLLDNEIGAEPQSVQAFTAISRSIKRLAQRIKKPVVVTTQALPGKMSKGVVTMHSLGWTSAWAQDADIILGVERDEAVNNWIRFRLVAGRNVSPREITLQVDWETSTFEEIDIAEEADDDE